MSKLGGFVVELALVIGANKGADLFIADGPF